MYGYEWTDGNGVYRLATGINIQKEIRPVFKEELDYFGLSGHWSYPDTSAPLLWAEGIRRYILNGECVAEAVGGGYYTKPTLKVYREGLALFPVDLDALWEENERLMLGLEKTAVDFIRDTHTHFAREGMAFAVAFSGGKDSFVLLDLVSRALAPEDFSVVFSDTGMELSSTYAAVGKAKKQWPNLRFYAAKSHLTPEESWEEFGPPGRRMRWCCAVHKSVPTILLLREITGNYDIKAVVFDGVRAEESLARASRDEISVGAKNINQINCSPILKWNSGELFLYLLHNNILLNDAYKMGFNRVGCTVCPLSSGWRDSLTNHIFHDEIELLLNKVEQYAVNNGISPNQREKYIEHDGWRTRMGGRGLPNGGNRVVEKIAEDKVTFSFVSRRQDWLSVCPILGPIVDCQEGIYTQLIKEHQFQFSLTGENQNVVTYWPYSKMDRYILSHLRGVANKTAYCFGCKACEAQCPVDAFVITDERKIYIREDRCLHCCNCIEYTNGKGCLTAKSLAITGGGNTMQLKGMNRYQTFGLRRPWLEHFFEFKEDCFTQGMLGTRQYDSLKVWLREAGLLTASSKGNNSGVPTPLFEKLKPLGAGHPLTWAVIWVNLSYNSIICRWYMLHAPAGEIYDKEELVFQLGDDYSKSTRDNAVTALFELFRHSPIGAVLKQGIPIASGKSYRFSRAGWNPPDAVAVLYAMYRFAEETGRYDFTLAQLEIARGNDDVRGVDPVAIFGLNPKQFRDVLQDISLQYEDYIHTTFVADLDNVKLFPGISSLDVLDLLAE